MKRVKDVLASILNSDAAAVAIGLALAYGYIKLALAFMDHMTKTGP